MKREIKFRAWHKTEKLMCPVTNLNNKGAFLKGVKPGKEQVIINFRMIIPADPEGRFCKHLEIELMQFTGLKDKNSKEIYESDILKTETDKPMVVTWSNKFASFCLNRDGWAFQHWSGEACNPENCESIGNIYENPELL